MNQGREGSGTQKIKGVGPSDAEGLATRQFQWGVSGIPALFPATDFLASFHAGGEGTKVARARVAEYATRSPSCLISIEVSSSRTCPPCRSLITSYAG